MKKVISSLQFLSLILIGLFTIVTLSSQGLMAKSKKATTPGSLIETIKSSGKVTEVYLKANSQKDLYLQFKPKIGAAINVELEGLPFGLSHHQVHELDGDPYLVTIWNEGTKTQKLRLFDDKGSLVYELESEFTLTYRAPENKKYLYFERFFTRVNEKAQSLESHCWPKQKKCK